MTKTAQTRAARKAALVAAVKCAICKIGLGKGKAIYSVGDGRYECAGCLS